MNNIYDLIIVGSGPAGLSAAIYAERAKLDTIVIEKDAVSGGQVLTTYEVDNYPGLPGISGYDLGMKLRAHADGLGAKFVEDDVLGIDAAAVEKVVHGKKQDYRAKTILIATGATHRLLGIPGEEEFTGMGVSYCATCDGAFFKQKVTAVVGGGDVALEDAIFLSRMCSKVYVIHRRNEFRGSKSLQEQIFATENIEVIWDTVVDRIEGKAQVQALILSNVKTKESQRLELQGVFVAVGIAPNSEPFTEVLEMESGYIRAGEDGKTRTLGVFAAGDVRTKALRQIVTAVSDGANAITSIERYLSEY